MIFKSIKIGAIALCVLSKQVAAQDLRFEFTIDAQIAGSRPWDGTASSSSALDSVGSGLLGDLGEGFIGTLADTAIDITLDEAQATMAPPDPYLCIIGLLGGPIEQINNGPTLNRGAIVTNGGYSASCTPRQEIKPNRLQFKLDLPTNIASLELFGVVLIDNDLSDGFGEVTTGPQVENIFDEVIGFGLYLRKDVRSRIVDDGNAEVLQIVRRYEEQLPEIVDDLFGLRRSNYPGEGQELELERLTAEGCNPSCRFGNASLTIKDTLGGW